MENTHELYDTLGGILRQCWNWVDARHMITLTWMVVGVILSEKIGLAAWEPYVQSAAYYAQSTVRRFSRWLHNERIHVQPLYGPLLQQALADWGDHCVRLVLDTSQLWGEYCIVRIAVVYRGRAVPVVWTVLKHASSSVAYAVYAPLLDEAAKLLPWGCEVRFLADRGFADTALLNHLKRLGWHWRIRIKSSFWVYHQGKSRQLKQVRLRPGQTRFWQQVWITQDYYGPVHLALARPQAGKENWYVLSDEPVGPRTFGEYGERFDIEENFLDDKSNGFQLESSAIRSAAALSRLCLVLAVATLYLVAQGTAVVAQQQRRRVDPHWFRGASYLRIGWRWVKAALAKHDRPLLTRLSLSGEPDPEPAKASRRQFRKRRLKRACALFF